MPLPNYIYHQHSQPVLSTHVTYSHPTHGTVSHTQHNTALQQNEIFPPNLFLLQCTRVLSVYHRRVESGENLISFYLETHCWRLGALEMENGGPRSITVSIELSSRNSSRLVDNSFEKYRIHLVNWTSKKSWHLGSKFQSMKHRETVGITIPFGSQESCSVLSFLKIILLLAS